MTRGKVIRQKYITRWDLQKNQNTYYMFGDNMLRKGLGGQAGQMRGEPNAIGVPTKWKPLMSEDAFFRDEYLQNSDVGEVIKEAFLLAEEKLSQGHDVVIPEDGLGTGLSDLANKAPQILELINGYIEILSA